MQQGLELAAVERVLRPEMALCEAAGLGPDAVAVPVEVRHLGGGHGDPGEGVAEAEGGEFLDGVRQQIDADADRPELRRRLDQPGPYPCPVQGEGGGEPSDPCPRDEHVDTHIAPPQVPGPPQRTGAGARRPYSQAVDRGTVKRWVELSRTEEMTACLARI